jgi:hypothetical protein
MLGLFRPQRQCMEFSMRNCIRYPSVGVALLLAGTSLARAQAVETVIMPAPTIIAQQPVAPAVVTQSVPMVETIPVQTTETVRTVESTVPRHIIASHSLSRSRTNGTVTTTRTTVRERIVPEPLAAAAPVPPAVAAITQPAYTEMVQGPPAAALTYPAPLYDVVPAPAIAPPALPCLSPVRPC